MTAAVDADRVVTLIRAHRYVYANEIGLHDGIDEVLRAAEIFAEREVILAPGERIDLLLPSGLGIEVKVAGTPGDVLRQLRRYATHDRVVELLLVTTRARHVRGLPPEVGGKKLRPLLLRGGL